MKKTLLPAVVLLMAAGWATAPAEAAGCLKGAAIGGGSLATLPAITAFSALALAASLVIIRQPSTLGKRLSNNCMVLTAIDQTNHSAAEIRFT
jgi:hypothetical protein